MSRKFATIDIETESNVGVIDLGELRDVHQDDLKSHLTSKVEDRLITALQEHFDYPVKIRVISSAAPVRGALQPQEAS